VGRTYSCWMLNCWCITWPVGFKRLKSGDSSGRRTREMLVLQNENVECSPICWYSRVYRGTRRHIPEESALITPNVAVYGRNMFSCFRSRRSAAVLTLIVFVVLHSACCQIVGYAGSPTSANFQSAVYWSFAWHWATETVVKWIVRKVICLTWYTLWLTL
jgi:hypothetical protein